jgi:hypothetical protein
VFPSKTKAVALEKVMQPSGWPRSVADLR